MIFLLLLLHFIPTNMDINYWDKKNGQKKSNLLPWSMLQSGKPGAQLAEKSNIDREEGATEYNFEVSILFLKKSH